MPRTKPDDLAYRLLHDGFESVPTVYSPSCYICNDPEFAQMGLPLCRACSVCGGHVAADNTRCDDCGIDDSFFWEVREAHGGESFDANSIAAELLWGYTDTRCKRVLPSGEQLRDALEAMQK